MKNRLRLIRKELKLTQEALAGRMGIGKSALSMIETGKAALSKRNMSILAQEFNVNRHWLEEGEGEMFDGAHPLLCESRNSNRENTQEIPLFDINATGGLSPLFADTSSFQPIGCIRVPHINKCDGAIYVSGEGMYPLLKSGDIVLYKQMDDPGDIFWGDMYLLSLNVGGEEYIMVKYIHKSDKPGFIRLVSQSPAHDDKDVQVSKIMALGFVKAIIRMNRPG